MTILESLQTLIGIISAVLIIVGLLYWAVSKCGGDHGEKFVQEKTRCVVGDTQHFQGFLPKMCVTACVARFACGLVRLLLRLLLISR